MTKITIFDPVSVLTARITHLLETLGSASLDQDYIQRIDKIENRKQLPTAITLNFRDPDYSPETGGFHPVEVRLHFPLQEAKELFRIFADNFCHYHTLGIFQMEITLEE